ncbi:MAG: hypothetical protein IPF41_10025 [Flavobacteriales bacterium]|nr:hypothetical protein [Flavobacteriales bacterium]
MKRNLHRSLRTASLILIMSSACFKLPAQQNGNNETIKIGDRLIRLSVEGYMVVSNQMGLERDPSFDAAYPHYSVSKYYRHEFTTFGRLSGGGGLNIEVHAFKNFQATYLYTGLHYQGHGFDVAVAQDQAPDGLWITNWSDPCALLKLQSLYISLSLFASGFRSERGSKRC